MRPPGYSTRPIEKEHIENVGHLIAAVRDSILKPSDKSPEQPAAAAPATAPATATAAAAAVATFDACATGMTNLIVNGDAPSPQNNPRKRVNREAETPITNTPSVCVNLRNTAVATLVAASDEGCYEHLRSMYGNEAAWNLTLGSLASLLTGSAAVVSSMTTKTNLAAAGTFFGSERT